MLKELVEKKLVDYVAMDIKTKLDFENYNRIVGGVLTKEMFENVKKSIEFLLKTKNYEFRTTIVKEFHTKDDIIEICKNIRGAKVYYLQNLKSDVELICGKKLTPFSEREIEEIVDEGKKFVNVSYRKG
jgi:pyruvate formate lyase activating enzyme